MLKSSFSQSSKNVAKTLELNISQHILYPTASRNTLTLFNQLVFEFRKCGSLKWIRSCIRRPRISQGWPIGDGLRPGRPVKGYDKASLQTVPCHIAGMLALSCWKKKNVSNSLINFQDMWVKDFMHIALACK